MVDKLFCATKALIVCNNKVLILRESKKYDDGTQTGKWDVPGGRVTPGERFDEGLVREVKEETGLDITVHEPIFVNEWRPEVRGEKWQIVATFFYCTSTTQEVRLSKDHDAYEWITLEDYTNHAIIPTNLGAFKALEKRKKIKQKD